MADQFRPSPLVGVFESAVVEFKRQTGNDQARIHNLPAIQRVHADRFVGRDHASRTQCSRGSRLPARSRHFVRTCSEPSGESLTHSTGWQRAGAAATLRAVAPGISEALDHDCGEDWPQPSRRWSRTT